MTTQITLEMLAGAVVSHLLDRANQTGTQEIGTIEGLEDALEDLAPGLTLSAIKGLPLADGAFIRGRGDGVAEMQPIIGQVSKAGSVPRGALFEFVNNSNGIALKFAEGTMICWGSIASTADAWTTASGSVFVGPIKTWTFPVPFASAGSPSVWGSGRRGASLGIGCNIQGFDATTATLNGWSSVSLAATSSKTLDVFAIGRWSSS